MLMKQFLLQQSFRLLPDSFIRSKSKNPITCDMKHFGKTVYGCKILIWMSEIVVLVNWPVFIWFQCFVVVQLLIV